MAIIYEWDIDQDLTETSAPAPRIIISPSDKDLVLSNLVCYADVDDYDWAFENSGMNWHSGGAIVGAKIKFADFSEETKRLLKRNFYDQVEYMMEWNAQAKDHRSHYVVPHFGIIDSDVVSLDFDDEWGLFIRIHRDNERFPYITFYGDGDPVLESLWGIDRKNLPLHEDQDKIMITKLRSVGK